jgi:hypothetical protein
MDISYWGPSAWQLFHLIAQGSPNPTALLGLIGGILPCKYCRESTTNFISDMPLTKGMDAARWMYEIHRMVNRKLTKQAETDPKVILPDPDPTFEDVHKKYAELLKKKPHAVPGRDFLFSIAYNYPEHPDYDQINTQQIFLKLLTKTYPFVGLRKVYAAYMTKHPLALESRSLYLRWMYGLLKALSVKTKSPIRTFRGYAHHVAYYKSGCAKSTYHGKTCRRLDDGGFTKQRDYRRTRRIASGGLLA